HFIASTVTAMAGIAVLPNFSFGAPAIIKNLGKPNSKIAGVQIGAITYSFRSMENDAESTLKYCLDSGISAIELMGYTAEGFAGAPVMPELGSPQKRKDMNEAEKKEMEELRAAYARELANWRSSVSPDKFKQLRRMYNDAGVSIYA